MIELAIAIAIVTTLMMLAAPSIIQVSRNSMAKRAVTDIGEVQQATLAWYYEFGRPSDGIIRTQGGSWPGQVSANTCTSVHPQPLQDLFDAGLIGSANPVNPWNMPYRIEVIGNAGACSAQITTDVPQDLANYVAASLDDATCVRSNTPGMSRCTSRLHRPGPERTVQEFDGPPITERICQALGGTFKHTLAEGRSCVVYNAAYQSVGDCNWGPIERESGGRLEVTCQDQRWTKVAAVRCVNNDCTQGMQALCCTTGTNMER